MHVWRTRLPSACRRCDPGRRPSCRCRVRCCCCLACRRARSEEHTSELQSLAYLVCRLLLEKKKVKAPVAEQYFFSLAVIIDGFFLRGGRGTAPPQNRLYFFFNDPATTEIYTLSLHDALPIYVVDGPSGRGVVGLHRCGGPDGGRRSEEHTSELLSLAYLVCRLLLEKKKTYSWRQRRGYDVRQRGRLWLCLGVSGM